MRRFVIGDIHGCSKALRTLIDTIAPKKDDELIFLGDYVDRGPDSRGVIDQLVDLQSRCNVIPLRGNHEIMLCGVAFSHLDPEMWLNSGGNATVTSYGGSLDKIPDSHVKFLRGLRPHYETQNAIFVHANYDHTLPMEAQPDDVRYWQHLTRATPPHCSGKRVYVGHTPQASGMVLDLGYLVCVDTYCFGTGYLTAMNVGTDECIQVDRKGFRRRVPAEALIQFFGIAARSIRTRLFGSKSATTVTDATDELTTSKKDDHQDP
ncbi:serine/threonine protein phosphatase [Stieleria sp. JC731]|uniref:metallophosphoesterase family protein n=1 Tax=Pirellulaceae TaxID=2691357 RepID=UPI001E371536|nr:metallophosphoesterase family protein [Stieleria sp. JC731]MCC9603457.1 serine/threonine protein phosphatase [Stieleria sp. JC731]